MRVAWPPHSFPRHGGPRLPTGQRARPRLGTIAAAAAATLALGLGAGFLPVQAQSGAPAGTAAGQPSPPAGQAAGARIGNAAAPYRTTAQNDTLWNIARSVAPPGVSPNQVMVAIARRNGAAFVGGNMFFMRVGVPLQLPSLDEVRAEDAGQAVAIVERHRGAWRAGRAEAPALGPLGAAAPAAPPAAAAPAPAVPPTGAPPVAAAPVPAPVPVPTPSAAPSPPAQPALPAPAAPPVASGPSTAPTSPPPGPAPAADPPPAAPPAATAPSSPPAAQPAATPRDTPSPQDSAAKSPSNGLYIGAGALALAGLATWLVMRKRRPGAADAEGSASARDGAARRRPAHESDPSSLNDGPAASALHRRPPAPPATPPLVQALGDEAPPLPSAAVPPEPALELLIAKAYLDVGDNEEARPWLRRVVEHGDEEQRQEAAQLLG